MAPNLLDSLLDGPFELTPQPEPVPGDLRLAWGIALVLLILGRSHGRRASLQKLHFLAHSARTRETRHEAKQVFEGGLRPSDFVVRVEPWLNRATAFAKGAGLIELERGRSAKLTELGIKTLDAVRAAETVLTEEKAFVDAFGPLTTESVVNKIMRMELRL